MLVMVLMWLSTPDQSKPASVSTAFQKARIITPSALVAKAGHDPGYTGHVGGTT